MADSLEEEKAKHHRKSPSIQKKTIIGIKNNKVHPFPTIETEANPSQRPKVSFQQSESLQNPAQSPDQEVVDGGWSPLDGKKATISFNNNTRREMVRRQKLRERIETSRSVAHKKLN